jgi:hypothetical protein
MTFSIFADFELEGDTVENPIVAVLSCPFRFAFEETYSNRAKSVEPPAGASGPHG